MYEKYRKVSIQCYLMLVILFADAQYRIHNQQIFRNLSYDEKKTLYFHGGYGDLPEDAGVYFLEISQPST